MWMLALSLYMSVCLNWGTQRRQETSKGPSGEFQGKETEHRLHGGEGNLRD